MIQLPILTPFAQTTAENIANDGFGRIVTNNADNPIIEINDADFYKIEPERLAQLNAPLLFEGYLSVQMRGTPAQAACQFLPQFADGRGQALHGVRREGCVLRLSQFTAYMLPQTMFELSELIEQANQPNADEALRWRVVERAKNAGERVRFEGLPDNTVFQNSHAVAIDVLMNQDGSVSIQPRINGVTEATYLNHKERLNEEGRTILVMTEVHGEGENRHVVRQITEAQVIKAHQRIQAVGRIAREDVSKFLDNPAAFILNDEESVGDVAIDFGSYRITGMGEPYVGYFGSKNLDSPIKQALMQDGDPKVHEEIRQRVVESVDKRSVTEVKALIERIEQAEQNSTPQIELPNGEVLPQAGFATAKAALSKVAQKATEQVGGAAGKLVIQIKPNDEEGIDFDFVTRKPLSEIRINHQEPSSLFNAIAFPPKSYQVAGVNWLKDLFDADYRGGILADDMGLGKTLQALAILLERAPGGPQLVVTPTSVTHNWLSESDRFAPTLKVRDYRRHRDLSQMGAFDVVVVSYGLLLQDAKAFATQTWHSIVLDEAQSIKNAQTQRARAVVALKADFRLALSGTPVENHLGELWSLFRFLNPGLLGSLKSFNQRFVSPAEQGDRLAAGMLKQLIKPFVLRRTKAQVLDELPPRTDVLYQIPMSEEELHWYEALRQQAVERLEVGDDVSPLQVASRSPFSIPFSIPRCSPFSIPRRSPISMPCSMPCLIPFSMPFCSSCCAIVISSSPCCGTRCASSRTKTTESTASPACTR